MNGSGRKNPRLSQRPAASSRADSTAAHLLGQDIPHLEHGGAAACHPHGTGKIRLLAASCRHDRSDLRRIVFAAATRDEALQRTS
jgi:hypothetical protein